MEAKQEFHPEDPIIMYQLEAQHILGSRYNDNDYPSVDELKYKITSGYKSMSGVVIWQCGYQMLPRNKKP